MPTKYDKMNEDNNLPTKATEWNGKLSKGAIVLKPMLTDQHRHIKVPLLEEIDNYSPAKGNDLPACFNTKRSEGYVSHQEMQRRMDDAWAFIHKHTQTTFPWFFKNPD